jgi:hypothetical protein
MVYCNRRSVSLPQCAAVSIIKIREKVASQISSIVMYPTGKINIRGGWV